MWVGSLSYCFFGFHVKVVQRDNTLLLSHPVGHDTECLLQTIVVSGLHHGRVGVCVCVWGGGEGE